MLRAHRSILRTLLSATLALLAIPALGENGDVDSTFGDSGVVRLGSFFGGALGWFEAIAVQPDGRMVVAGVADRSAGGTEIVALRLDTSGQLDRAFGNSGTATVNTGAAVTAHMGVNDLVIDADGNVLLMGARSDATYVVKLDASGQLDPTFGSSGIATIARFSGERIALQADGRLLVLEFGGHVVRLLPNGARDAGFTFVNPVGRGRGLAIDSSGRVVSGGDSAPRNAVVITRSMPNGTRDTLFGDMGTATIPVAPGEVFASDLAIDAAGRIYVSAVTSSGCPASCDVRSVVIRLRTDGSVDPAFGTEGVLSLGVPGKDPLTRGIALLPDGRVVLAGVAGTRGGGAFFELFAVALNDDASLYSGFGLGGWQEIDVNPGGTGYLLSEDRSGVAVLPAGRIAVLDFGCACLTLLEAPAWSITPRALQFASDAAVALNSVRTSSLETVTGLDPNASVGVIVSGGEWALNGSTSYSSRSGWVSNGSRIDLRHLSASTVSTTVTTTVRIGGLRPKNNEALLLGAVSTSGFSSTTTAPPILLSPVGATSIAENLLPGAEVAVIASTDPDGDPLSYTITGGTGHGAFAIDSTGRVTTRIPLDHETLDMATLQIEVSDGKGGRATHTVAVTVTDVQEPPQLLSGTGSFTVSEALAPGSVIATVVANDPDQDTLLYALTAGNDAGRFAIDSAGRITIAAPLDFETATSYTLTVGVSDNRGGTTSGTITVQVMYVAEPLPAGSQGGGTSTGTSSNAGGGSSGGGGGGGGSFGWLGLALLCLCLLRDRVLRDCRAAAHKRRI